MNTISLLLSLGLFGLGALLGWDVEHTNRVADVAQIKGAYARATAAATAEASRQQSALVSKGNALARTLDDERDQAAKQIATFKRKITDATTRYRPTPAAPARPLPECIVTTGAVGLWNNAIAARPDSADTDASPSGADDPASAADTVDSGVRLPDLLAHHLDYAGRCRAIERQLNRLIDYVEFDPAAAQ
jgi:hypothetical protein